MNKSIFCLVGIAAIAAVLCAGCGDLGVKNEETYTLTAIATSGGTVARYPDKDSYKNGEQVAVVATSETGYTFAGWSGASTSTSPTMTISMDGNKTLTANFARITYKITTKVSPASGGNIDLNPNKTAYNAGEAVSVTATPNANYTFLGWSGSSTSKDAAISIVMDGNRKLTANFAQTANAVIITLTSWQTTVTDVGGGRPDPKLHFVVTAYRNGSQISSNNTGYLLDATDVSQPWSGSEKSSPVSFMSQADSLVIRAVVVEKDPLFPDDISPGTYNFWSDRGEYPIPAAGSFGSAILKYGNGKSEVGYSYEFILQ